MTAADALARAGDSQPVSETDGASGEGSPTDTLMNSVWLPVARASNQIHANQAGASRGHSGSFHAL